MTEWLKKENEIWEDFLSSRPEKEHEKEDKVKLFCEEWLKKIAKKEPTHSCSQSCHDQGKIDVISVEQRLYGCVISGRIHQCNKDSSCIGKFTNEAEVCLYSGIQIAQYYSSAEFGKSHNESYGTGDGSDYSLSMFQQDVDDDCAMTESIPMESQAELLQPILNKKKEIIKEPGPKKKKPRKCLNIENAQNSDVNTNDARDIINNLLYNTSGREHLNMKQEKELQRVASNAIIKYYKTQFKKGKRPNYHAMLKIYHHQMNTKRLLSLLDKDIGRLDYYCGVVTSLWNVALKSDFFRLSASGDFNFKDHVIGTLYMLQVGFRVDELQFQLIQPDAYLNEHLPDENFLRSMSSGKFKFKKGDITRGVNNVKACLNSIVWKISSVEELQKLKKKIYDYRNVDEVSDM